MRTSGKRHGSFFGRFTFGNEGKSGPWEVGGPSAAMQAYSSDARYRKLRLNLRSSKVNRIELRNSLLRQPYFNTF